VVCGTGTMCFAFLSYNLLQSRGSWHTKLALRIFKLQFISVHVPRTNAAGSSLRPKLRTQFVNDVFSATVHRERIGQQKTSAQNCTLVFYYLERSNSLIASQNGLSLIDHQLCNQSFDKCRLARLTS
jgi:hypothetical protein